VIPVVQITCPPCNLSINTQLLSIKKVLDLNQDTPPDSTKMRLSLPLISAIAATVVPAAQARANPAVRHDILLPTRDSAPARHNPDLNRAVSRGGLVTVVRATASLGPNLNRQTITLHASYTETVTTYIERTPVTIPAEEPSPPKDRNTTTYLPSATVTPQVQPTSVKAMDELDRFKPVTANLDGLPACLVWHLQWSPIPWSLFANICPGEMFHIRTSKGVPRPQHPSH
jgi:hypothetical protein